MNTENEIELTDSVDDATAATLREKNPGLFGDDPPASKLADLTPEDLAAIAGTDTDVKPDADDAADEDDDDKQERDAAGRFVPRARLDELTAQRNKEREAREAAEARLAKIEKEQQDAAEAARVAAEAKAKEVHDYEADRDALQAKHEANEIDTAEFLRELRKIDKAERQQDQRITEENALARLRKEQKEERDRAESQSIEQAATEANTAAAEFLAKPENAAYKTDRFRIAALNTEREAIFAERNGDISWADLLVEAKKRVEEYLGAAKPEKKGESDAERTTRERKERQARATAEASSLPSRPDGGVGARATTEPEDENDISPEEYRRLPKAERDRRLGKDGRVPAKSA